MKSAPKFKSINTTRVQNKRWRDDDAHKAAVGPGALYKRGAIDAARVSQFDAGRRL